jgi:hypothetical protein
MGFSPYSRPYASASLAATPGKKKSGKKMIQEITAKVDVPPLVLFT